MVEPEPAEVARDHADRDHQHQGPGAHRHAGLVEDHLDPPADVDAAQHAVEPRHHAEPLVALRALSDVGALASEMA